MKNSANLENITKVGKGSLVNINWELVSHCQFKCTYCYYKPFESQTNYETLSKIILKKISSIKEQTKITLLGGEPTLHPAFYQVIEALHALPHVQSIPIVTNFEKPLDFWIKLLPFKDKIKIVISFHPEYPQTHAFEKIRALQDLFSLDLVFILHNKLKFLPKMKQYAENLETINLEKISTNFVRIHDSGEYLNYPEEIEEFITEQNHKSRIRKNTEQVNVFNNDQWSNVPKFDLINNKLNRFEGWSCKLKAFIIHEDGMVSSACSKIKKHILIHDFKETTLKCTYKICECDDYWEFPKEKMEFK